MRQSFHYMMVLACFIASWGCRNNPPGQSVHDRLLEAVLAGNQEVVDSCLQNGGNPNLRDDEGTPLLILAVNTGKPGILASILRYRVSIDARRQSGYQSTALMETALRNDLEAAKLLLSRGAGVNLRDSIGDTALHWAAFYGRLEIARLLCENGAGLSITSREGTPLDVALWQFNDAVADYLAAKDAAKRQSGEFVEAVRAGNEAAVNQLLRAGANHDQMDGIGSPVLVIAASRGFYDIVKLLLKKEADPDLMNRVGQTALCRAVYFGHEDIAKLLVSHGASINKAGPHYQMTPLHAAAKSAQPAIGQWLIENGARVDAQEGISGYTPLMIATSYGRQEMVKVLIKAHANPHIKGFDGAALPDLINYAGQPEIARLLEEYMLQQ
ncbi:MAG: ankyrin repeat domain-containing protein [Saprospiraceae bacterium]|nr:ankyrin repeat domain-containing protein [Saprospiraceae bacterium]